MAVVAISDSILTDIADAIRSKNGTENTYKPAQMPDAIEAISGGGITPTGTIEITQNGVVDVTNYASADVDVPTGSTPVINSLSVTENGTYTAPSGIDGYSPITVNVPQGSTPTGTKQISITQNGTTTEDVTNYASAEINVNVPSSGVTYDDICMKNFSGNVVLSSATKIKANTFYSCPQLLSVESDTVTELEGGAIAYCTALTKIRLPNVTKMVNYSLQRNTNANMQPIVMPKLVTTGTYMFERVTATLDFTDLSSLIASSLRNWYGNVLILRKSDAIVTLANINAFDGSPFASGNAGGTLYVPSALISTYQSATNWSTILGYATNSIQAIEGSVYENAYADGTPIST